ncbi:MAG: PQQ-binding-like beta-propeller repeat protein [Phycisphaerales bacterium]|nr:PQQ-binding-like beta-propeller repeat protein [Phycisphaerales bacterium]
MRTQLLTTLLATATVASPSLAQTITDVSATTVPRSARLVIHGAGFGSEPGTVLIGGLTAPITHWSDAKIRAYVPETTALGGQGLQVVAATPSNVVTLEVTMRPPADGRTLWRFEADADYTLHRTGLAPDGTIYFDDVRGRLYAITPDGGLKWIFDTLLGAAGLGSKGPVAVDDEGTAYVAVAVGGPTESLVAVRADGTLKWAFTVPIASGWIAGPAIGPDGNVYAVLDSAQQLGNPYDVLALTPDGAVAWTTAANPATFEVGQFGSELLFGPTTPGGPLDQLICNADQPAPGSTQTGRNYGFDVKTGEQRFAVPAGGINNPFMQGQTQLAVDRASGSFYMTEFAGSGGGWGLQAFDANGLRTWRYDPGILGAVSEPEVASDGTILFAWDLGAVIALEPDGRERWTVDTDQWFDAPVASPSAAELVLLGSAGIGEPGYVETWSTTDGAVLWRHVLGGLDGEPVTTTTKPRYTPSGDRVYFTGEPMAFSPDPSFLLFAVRTTAEPVAGDITGDGVVDFIDLLSLLAAWGPCPAPPTACPADLDGDGSVGIVDLLLVLANWS